MAQTIVAKFDLNIERILESSEVYRARREVIANAPDEQALTGTSDVRIMKDAKGVWHIRDYGRGLKCEHLTPRRLECVNPIARRRVFQFEIRAQPISAPGVLR